MKRRGFDVQQAKEKRSRKTILFQHLHQEHKSGRRNKRWLDRFARFSLLSSSFDSQPARPTLLGPPPRYFHASSFVLNEKALYIQGGMNKTDYLGDFWSFDVLHRTWQRLTTFHNSRCCDENSNPLVETQVNIVFNNLKIWNIIVLIPYQLFYLSSFFIVPKGRSYNDSKHRRKRHFDDWWSFFRK